MRPWLSVTLLGLQQFLLTCFPCFGNIILPNSDFWTIVRSVSLRDSLADVFSTATMQIVPQSLGRFVLPLWSSPVFVFLDKRQ
jgi:hypothetical protein